MTAPMTADEACGILDVSRETRSRFEAYIATLTEWQNRMNLVSRASLDDVWRRHILDCGQLAAHIGHRIPIMDIGSGAGLPGLILAAMPADTAPPPAKMPQVILVESSTRKCGFLLAAASVMGITDRVKIIPARIEALPPHDPLPVIITARAVAPVDALLRLTSRQHHPGLECCFFKGARYKEELLCLGEFPNIRVEIIPSASNPESAILHLRGFQAIEKQGK